MLFWLSACAFHVPPPTSGAPEPLPLVAPAEDRGRLYTLVDGRLWFVDTGASRTTCDDGFVAALGLEPRPALLRVQGEVGSVPVGRAVLRDVTIGGWTFRRLPCAVRDLSTTSSLAEDPDDPVAGVIGANLLGHFAVDLDRKAATLRLVRKRATLPKELRGGARLRHERGFGSRLVVDLVVDGEAVPVVVDTGADRTYLPLETGEEIARYRGVREGTGEGGSATVDVVIRRVEAATVGGRPVGVESYVYREGRPGLVGMDALAVARLVVDGRVLRMAWIEGNSGTLPTPDEARAISP